MEHKKTSERPRDDAERLIWKELLKAGTSVGANSSESSGAQSDSDFIAKFQIALKEGKESALLAAAAQARTARLQSSD